MWKLLLFFPCFVFGQADSMLAQADFIAQKYNVEVARTPPPSANPQQLACLNRASIWFSIDLSQIKSPAFKTLSNEALWDSLREIGIQGVHLKGLKEGGEFRTKIALDPKWGNDWLGLALTLQKKGIVLIGDAIGNATGLSPDFCLALKNVGEYPGLYHLVEIEKRDWQSLPNVPKLFANIPWLTLQELHKKGYVPEQFAPYVKESSWNATGPINCIDGKVRRWIYLKENRDDPVINWLSPSFAGYRIATADTLDSIYNLGQKIIHINDTNSKDTLALWTRKLGSFSVLETEKGIKSWKRAESDMIVDTLTRSALLHALIAEDAEVLKLIYRLFLDEGIETNRLVHVLQPFDHFTCDYAEFLAEPKRRFQYYEEILTGEALRLRLLKEDVAKIGGQDPVSWSSLCMDTLKIERDEMMNAHLLLALFYSMQPGAFSFSVSDLLGLSGKETVDIMEPNERAVYGSLFSQMKNSCSFARKLRNILMARINLGIESAELWAVPDTKQRGVLVLLHRLKGSHMIQMLAINFSSMPASQVFEIPSIRQTSAIDLITGLAEKKPLDSASFRLDLPALSGKVILFQTKYYD